MDLFRLRAVTQQEFGEAADWAAAEGWNPGLDDVPAFFAADPQGFFMGFMDGRPVSSISVVRYGDAYGFLGFYIVHPDYRGTGLGMATWEAGLAHLAGRTVGLDGVVAQQDNYRKSGFVYAGRNIRYTGVPLPEEKPSALHIREIGLSDLAALQTFDQTCFPAPRPAFLKTWVLPGNRGDRVARCAVADGRVQGYGVIRRCRSGNKIGPLFAADGQTARALFTCLCQTTSGAEEVSLDLPEDNRAARALAEDAGLSPVFETARMYKGPQPNLPLARIFGLTTFELG